MTLPVKVVALLPVMATPALLELLAEVVEMVALPVIVPEKVTVRLALLLSLSSTLLFRVIGNILMYRAITEWRQQVAEMY